MRKRVRFLRYMRTPLEADMIEVELMRRVLKGRDFDDFVDFSHSIAKMMTKV